MTSNSRQPIAYHLTWTTYGTWLRGDKRGYVGRTLSQEGSVTPPHNEYHSLYDADDGRTYNRDANALKSSPVHLNAQQAACAATALCEAAEHAGYELLRAAVMADHVHVLVAAHPDGKREMLRRLKNVAAVRLTQQFGRPAPRGCPSSAGNPSAKAEGSRIAAEGSRGEGGRWWTRLGSLREKWDEGSAAAAMEYIVQQTGKLAEVVDGRMVSSV
jgi:REP element-mobilizing transposase RayT